jgi:subtilisin family serine protease
MYKPFLAATMLGVLVGLPITSTVRAAIPNDVFWGDQWYLNRIEAPDAWGISTGDSDLIIAVLDTGVDLDHPDLVNNLWTNKLEVAQNGKDDDGNGFVDDIHGWDFVDDDAVPEPEAAAATVDTSPMSHGTLIAGLIGAEANNELGYAGLLWQTDIMAVRVLNENGVGDEEATAEAIDYAVANGARVINMSFAGTSSGSRLRTAVRRAYDAGVVIVAALGNDGTNLDITPVYPACFRSEVDDWVLGVGATGWQDEETEFTNYGATCADLSAPGVDILGLDYQDAADDTDSEFGGPWNGTSISSPLVAGAAGLLLSKYPTLTPAQVFTILKLSVDPIKDTLSGLGSIGVGRLNIGQALVLAPSFAKASDEVVVKPIEDEVVDVSTPTADSSFTDSAYYSFVALGAPAGVSPAVQVFRADGTPYASFNAYTTNFTGGVRVVTEDIDGDAIPEIITGAGPGGGPHVRLFKPYGAVISEFFAYANNSDQGVNVAVGDVDGDSVSDVVTAVGLGVSNDVIVWTQTGVEQTRFTVTGFADNAPLSVAVADVDDDWEKEIVVFSEAGESRVAIYNADGTRVVDFLAFPGDLNGVRVDVGDLDGDYRDEIITVGGTGATAAVRIYNKIGAFWGGINLPQSEATNSLRVSVTDIDINGEPDIIVSPLSSAGNVSVYSLTGDLLDHIGDSLIGSRGAYLSAW